MMYRYAIRRTLLAVLAMYLVVSIAFGVLTYTPDPNLEGQLFQMQRGGATEAEMEAFRSHYLEIRGQDRPVQDRYVSWLVAVSTLDFGYSATRGQSVASLLLETLPFTLGYVVPAVVMSSIAGVLLGVRSALHAGSWTDRWSRYSAYVVFGIPNWWIGVTVIAIWGAQLGYRREGVAVWEQIPMQLALDHWVRFAIPALVLATSLFAVQLRYARMEALEYLGEDYPRLLRAKGAGPRDVAAHTIRNTSVPLLSLFFAELVTVLVVNIYVMEAAFQVPGIGKLTLQAIGDRDVNVVMASTMLLVGAAIFGNLLQDLAYIVLDPRAAPE